MIDRTSGSLWGMLIVLFVLAGGTAHGERRQDPGPQDAPPNIVFVLVDDLGYTDVPIRE